MNTNSICLLSTAYTPGGLLGINEYFAVCIINLLRRQTAPLGYVLGQRTSAHLKGK